MTVDTLTNDLNTISNDLPHDLRLEALRRARHVSQGEDGSIVFLKRDPMTNALTDLFTINKNWSYGVKASGGEQLPPDVLYELQVSETQITKPNLKLAAAIRHGQRVFRIVGPSPFEPAGFRRYWRFWISPVEEV